MITYEEIQIEGTDDALDEYTLQLSPPNSTVANLHQSDLGSQVFLLEMDMGPNISNIQLQQDVGLVFTMLNWYTMQVYNISQPFPSKMQTHIRAEMCAIVIVIQNIEIGVII